MPLDGLCIGGRLLKLPLARKHILARQRTAWLTGVMTRRYVRA